MNQYTKQANQFLAATNTKFSAKFHRYGHHFENDADCRAIFTCTFKRNGKQFSLEFGQSIAEGDKVPEAYDVLACLQKYDIGSFEDFCSEFGYSGTDDSLCIYDRVCDEFEKVSNFWTKEELEQLREID